MNTNNSTKFHVIIPARLNSSRLPRKLLLDLGGIPVLQHVYNQAIKSNPVSVTIATDSEEIADVASRFGAKVCMTESDHQNGTERLSEACKKLELTSNDIIVNVQGDEPFISPGLIADLAGYLEEKSTDVATYAKPINNFESILNPNIVKVLISNNDLALFFTRAPSPWYRDGFNSIDNKPFNYEGMDLNNFFEKNQKAYFQHIGIYAYRAGTLKNYVGLSPSSLENLEKLEQLRFLWHNKSISVKVIDDLNIIGIDTIEDLQLAREFILANKLNS